MEKKQSSQMKNSSFRTETSKSSSYSRPSHENKRKRSISKLKGNKFARHRMKLLRALRDRKKKKKYCFFCSKKNNISEKSIHWRNFELLNRFLFSNFQIIGRKFSGVCNHHQRLISKEIKKAKNMALIRTIDY